MRRVVSRLVLLSAVVAWLAACSLAIDGPGERQRATDREDADRLAAQLASLPGVISARASIHRVAANPLAPRAKSTPDARGELARFAAANDGSPRDWPADSSPPDDNGASVVLVVDDTADRAALERDARKLTRVVAPQVVEPAMVVSLGAPRPELASVGPFRVEVGSRRPLLIVLFVALGALLAMAGWVIYTRRNHLVSPQLRSAGRATPSRPPSSSRPGRSSPSRPPSSRPSPSQPPTRREAPPRDPTRAMKK